MRYKEKNGIRYLIPIDCDPIREDDYLSLYLKHQEQLYSYSLIMDNGTKIISASEARSYRYHIGFVPDSFKSIDARNRDIRFMFKYKPPKVHVEKKKEMASLYGLSLSQVYRIIKEPVKRGKKPEKKVALPKVIKKSKPVYTTLHALPENIRVIVQRFRGLPDLLSGKRNFYRMYAKNIHIEDDAQKWLEMLEHENRAFIVGNKVYPFSSFLEAHYSFKTYPSPDHKISEAIQAPLKVVRAIRHFNCLPLSAYSSPDEKGDEMQAMVSMMYIYRLFKRKMKILFRFISDPPEEPSFEKVADAFHLSESHLYRKIRNKELKTHIQINPPSTNMLMQFQSHWFDIDSFLNPSELKLNF